jgi:NCS1 family nucleobase:cation symporter-1
VRGNRLPALLSWVLAVGIVVGWGLVTSTYASWLHWQGYLLGPLGLGGKSGPWAFANLGVLAALVVGFAGTLLTAPRVRAQERRRIGDALPRRGILGQSG